MKEKKYGLIGLVAGIVLASVFFMMVEPEPVDLDAIHEEAYEEGYEQAKSEALVWTQVDLDAVEDKAFKKGYNEAKRAYNDRPALSTEETPLVWQAETGAKYIDPRADPAEVYEHDYVLNYNSMKFHKPECEWADKVADYNREDVHCTRQEVIDYGFSPCKVCCP